MADQKITQVEVAASISASENPTFYAEKGGAFKRITLNQLKDVAGVNSEAMERQADVADLKDTLNQ